MLKKEEYLKTVRRPYPPLFCSLVGLGYSEVENYSGLLDEPFCIKNMAHVDKIWWYGKAELERGGELALSSWRKIGKLQKIKDEFKKRENDLVSSASKTFADFCTAYKRYMPPLALIFASEKAVNRTLREYLNKKLNTADVENVMNELNIPLEDNIYKLEEYDLVTSNNISDHVKKYEWLNARYGEERKYTIEEAVEKLSQINKDEYLNKRREEKEKLGKLVEQTKELLNESGVLVDIFQYIIYYRTHRTDTMNKAAYLAIPMLKEVAFSLGLSYEEILNCSASEILNNKIPPKGILVKRATDCSTILDNGTVRLLSDEESRKLIDFFKEEMANAQEFTGNIAQKGKVQGVVRVVRDRNDFSKVEDGNILITSMTTPEMVPIMKKAAAFVTDEGGVTCHAAIISREMKKPCIIGTKIATRVLKDGDIVEVDAERGIVRVLSKK